MEDSDRKVKSITHNKNERIKGVCSGEKNRFECKIEYHGSLLEVGSSHFHENSAVLLPETASGSSSSSGQGRVTGHSILAACFRQVQKNPQQQLLIAGHRGRSEGKARNRRLSERRAENVHYALLGDRHSWANVADVQHVAEDIQVILQWCADTFGWNCEPGSISGNKGPNTERAVRNLQQRYNEKRGGTFVDVNGNISNQTWKAILDLYMEELRRILGVDQKSIEKEREKFRFLSQPTIGCGKEYTDNRGEILFFDPGEEPPGDCEEWCQTLYEGGKYTFTPISPKPVSSSPKSGPPNDIHITGLEASHFVPGRESLAIDYEIRGPLSQVNSLRLLVMREDQPNTRLFEQSVDVPAQPRGTCSWDGSVTDDDFEGVANLEEAPYVVQLILHEMSGVKHESNKARVDVLLAEVEISVESHGLDKLSDDEKGVVQDVENELANNNGEAKIVYDSPVFKKSSAEMNNDSSYQEYKNEWDQGVRLPVYARIWLRGKNGAQKRFAKATANTKIIWDVRLDDDTSYDQALGDRGVHVVAQAFLRQVSDYKREATNPQGRTAHKYFGGMRAKANQRTADQEQWRELKSDWSFQTPSKRVWAAYTVCKPGTAIDAETGVLFRGGRVAGDIHHVKAYVETETSLDTEQNQKLDDLPSEQQSNELSFENWRRVEIVQNNIIGAATTELDLNALDTEYDKAAMQIESANGVNVQDIQASWRKKYQNVIGKLKKNHDFVKHAALDDPGEYPVRFREFADYQQEIKQDMGRLGKSWRRVKKYVGAADEEAYQNRCDKYARIIYTKVTKRFSLEDRGLNLYKFGEYGCHDQWQDSYTAGTAPYISDHTGRHKAVFLVFEEGRGTETLIHEVGHLLFLAHAPGHDEPGEQPPGYQPNAHDENQACLMSYDSSADTICGQCILKLEGWDYTVINNDGSVDEKNGWF